MIDKSNFPQVLQKLKFSHRGAVWTRHFGSFDCDMKVDFTQEHLIYPEDKGLKVNDYTTCNFAANENFVVFECVCRLLAKGYNPSHIELEPRWTVGRGASGGKADIQVKDNDGHSLLIIECKTFGREFKNAWQDTLEYGAQLFSYVQQARETQFIALYASDFSDDTIKFDYYLVRVQDDENVLKSRHNALSFKDANSAEELYKVWKETYERYAATRGLFEDDIATYSIGKTKYTIKDLKEVDGIHIEELYHKFATILRQHNVSGHENAFDKLVNLFIAKIVDEKENASGERQELAFHWKGAAYDDIKLLIDRLQGLYKTGMDKFLGDTITYIEQSKIDEAFKNIVDDPDETKRTVWNYFIELKYYSNNDFAFIEVHNKSLFDKNAEILLKIVSMLEDIKLNTEIQNQFLGDLFEGFLDDGVKQSEGQFFTPFPIVRFIVSSLPLKAIITGSRRKPKVIDYACGAGHFLNEYAHQIKPLLKEKNAKEYYAAITGIEKEYRLSKVAKVAAFMYGQDDIEIIHRDALDRHCDDVKDGDFSILVANPPYSVKGFLETLDKDSREAFQLFKESLDIQSNNAIETFFIERAKQLLKSGGIAAIILPSSVLSNGNIYIRAREILLKYFDIIAIVEFGSATFGKTGTNTVTLFLSRKGEKPDFADHCKNRVNKWFAGDIDEQGKENITYGDLGSLYKYCDYVAVNYDEYKTLLLGRPSDVLLSLPLFKDYRKDFEGSSEYKRIQNKKKRDGYSEKDREAETQKAYLEYLRSIEKDKLYYWILAYNNSRPVVIVKSPQGTKEMQAFLGYSWSERKGSEGIKYNGVTGPANEDTEIVKNRGIQTIQTPLFNPANLYDEAKINSLIRANFEGRPFEIPSALREFVSAANLTDMLDFSRVTFDKALHTQAQTKVDIKSKWPLVKLGGEDGVCDILIGGTPSRRVNEYFTGKNLWVSIAEMNGNVITDTKEKITDEAVCNSNVKLIPKGTTLLSFKLSIGKTAIAGADLYTNEAIAALVPKNASQLLNKYLFCIFNGRMIDLENVGAKVFGKSLNSAYLREEVKIPLPPLDVQSRVVAECEKIDEEYNAIRMTIEIDKAKIARIFDDLEVMLSPKTSTGGKFRLSDDSTFSVSIGKRVVETELIPNGPIPVYSANVFEPMGFVDKKLITDFSVPSVLWGIDGDWMVNYIPANTEFYPTDHCGVLRVKTDAVEPRLLAGLLEREGKRQRFSRTLRASIDRIKSLSIAVPPLADQRKIIAQVEALEAKIAEAEVILAEMGTRKKAILAKYL